MSVEKFIYKDPSVVEQTVRFKEKHPDTSLSYLVALELGNEGAAGIIQLDRKLRERIIIPHDHGLFPKAGLFLFEELTWDEREPFVLNYISVALASLSLAIEALKKEPIFKMSIAVELFKELVGSTCAGIPQRLPNSTVHEAALRGILDRYESGEFLFTDRDLYNLHPHLGSYLRTYGVLPALQDVMVPAQLALVKAIKDKLPPQNNEMAKYVGPMPVSAHKRELSDGLSNAEADAAFKSLEDNFHKPYKGPEGR